MYKRILVVLESDPGDNAAAAQALALAQVHRAELVWFAAVPTYAMGLTEYPAMSAEAAAMYLTEAGRQVDRHLMAAQEMSTRAGLTCQVVRLEGQDHADAVVETARDLHCDLIAVQSLGRNAVVRLLVGSLIPGLITRSRVPVLVVRHADAPTEAAGDRSGTAAEPVAGS